MNNLSPAGQLSRGRRAVLASSGSAWGQEGNSVELLATVGEYREQRLAELTSGRATADQREIVDHTSDYAYVAYRTVRLSRPIFTDAQTGQSVAELPIDIVRADAVRCQGVYLESLLDFTQTGRHLVFGSTQPAVTELTLYRAVVRTGLLSNFWGNVFHYHDAGLSSDRFYRALHRTALTTGTQAAFCELLGAAFDVPCCSIGGTVEQVIERDRFASLVITDQETLAGQPGDLATCQVGDVLQPGDFVFDSLRFHDFIEQPPGWLTELTIPREFFPTGIQGAMRITATPSVPFGVSVDADGRPHVQIPWDAEVSQDLTLFNSLLRQYEEDSGNLLADVLLPGWDSVDVLVATEFDWLNVLWSIWLRRRASVSLVRDRPDASQLHRYRQLRRALPPWTTHLVQFLQPPENLDVLC